MSAETDRLVTLFGPPRGEERMFLAYVAGYEPGTLTRLLDNYERVLRDLADIAEAECGCPQ
jgi:hypothetical protein